MKISKQKLLQIIKEEVSEIAVKRDKEGKMAKFDAKEAYEDYAYELSARDADVPTDEEVEEYGQFNGQGSW